MRRKTKAQVQEMFFYILALFIIGTILLLGIKYVGKILDQVETIDLVEFKTSLIDDTDIMMTKYGSWERNTYSVPKGVKTVCFFTIKDGINPSCLGSLDLLMCDAWKSGTQNVMTNPWSDTSINLTRMEVDKNDAPANYLCFDAIDGKITIKMTGKGNGVLVSKP
jgi:hypothetical protein